MAGISKTEFFFPRTSDKNKWADYFEILCLINENETISLDSIVDRIVDEKAGSSEDAIDEIENIGDFENDEDTIAGGFSEDELVVGSVRPDRSDKLNKKIKQHVDFLFYRIAIYGSSYPFTYDKKYRRFKLKKKLSLSQKLYLTLLISANLDYAEDYISPLTKEFERCSLFLFKKVLNNCSAHYFGANGIITSRYRGSLIAKFNRLKEDIHLPFAAFVTPENVGKHNSGDKGLDIVGWYDFKDEQPGTFLYFAQCACGKNWIDKALEAHYVTWDRVFQFFNKPVTILFSPVSFRNPVGNWYNPFDIHQDFILIDRLRILQTIPEKNVNDILKPYSKILKEIISNKKDYFD